MFVKDISLFRQVQLTIEGRVRKPSTIFDTVIAWCNVEQPKVEISEGEGSTRLMTKDNDVLMEE